MATPLIFLQKILGKLCWNSLYYEVMICHVGCRVYHHININFFVIKIYNPCICTQIFSFVNLKYLAGIDPSNLCNRTTCLSKVQGLLARTHYASDSSSKTKRRIWSPASRTLNSFLALHNGLKVRPIASTLRALFVINFVAKTNSLLRMFFDFDRLSFVSSSSVSESFFQS